MFIRGLSIIVTTIVFALLTAQPVRAEQLNVELAFDQITSEFHQDFEIRKYKAELRAESSQNVSLAAANIFFPSRAVIFYNEELAATEELSLSDWTIVLCHEVGHLIGGAPFVKTNPNDGDDISAEGQADYFAAAKCLRRLWINPIANLTAMEKWPKSLMNDLKMQACESAQCMRIVGSFFQFYYRLNPQSKMSISERSTEFTRDTKAGYVSNSAQCRLDTILAGALCPVSEHESYSTRNQKDGACTSIDSREEYRKYARPACWFNPYSHDRTF